MPPQGKVNGQRRTGWPKLGSRSKEAGQLVKKEGPRSGDVQRQMSTAPGFTHGMAKFIVIFVAPSLTDGPLDLSISPFVGTDETDTFREGQACSHGVLELDRALAAERRRGQAVSGIRYEVRRNSVGGIFNSNSDAPRPRHPRGRHHGEPHLRPEGQRLYQLSVPEHT